MPETTEEERRVVHGIDAETASQLEAAFESMPLDSDELGEGGLAEADITITGFQYQVGEGTFKGDDGKDVPRQDSVLMHQRIDNAPDLGIDYDTTVQYINMAREVTRPDGSKGRAKPTRTSKYGALISAFEGVGIVGANKAADPAYDGPVAFIWAKWTDLIGLQYHRERVEFQGFRPGQTFNVDIPTELLGVDNNLRAEVSADDGGLALEPVELQV